MYIFYFLIGPKAHRITDVASRPTLPRPKRPEFLPSASIHKSRNSRFSNGGGEVSQSAAAGSGLPAAGRTFDILICAATGRLSPAGSSASSSQLQQAAR